ncbi:MAG: 50S ribosomal protein L31e [Candidatus Bathyarchaeia archaeon]|nr:50S ribosomal protein L31e [Candidatus Bathyarchaeia archaeon]
MKEENEEEKQKTNEEQTELTETAEEAESEEKAEEILEKEEEIVEEAAVEAEEEMPEPIEEEVKPPPREERLKEEEIVEERIYTIPLSKAWIAPPNKRAPKAIRIIKAFLTRHMKLEAHREGEMEEEEPKRLIISNEVNERVWIRGIEKPPRKIRVRAAKDKEGNITVYLAEGD